MLEVLLKKAGRITKEYTLLNPAIGKGNSILPLNIFDKEVLRKFVKPFTRRAEWWDQWKLYKGNKLT